MSKTKVADLRKHYPELDPDRDYPPLRFKSLKGRVSAAEWPAMRRLADRLDPSYKT